MKTWLMSCALLVTLIGCGKEDPKPQAIQPDPAALKETPESLLTEQEKEEIALTAFVSDMETCLAGEEFFLKPDAKKPGFLAEKGKLLLEDYMTRCTEMIEKYPNDNRLKPLLERANKAHVALTALLATKQESDPATPKEEETKKP